jgi:hypothetical protein
MKAFPEVLVVFCPETLIVSDILHFAVSDVEA